MGGVLIFSVEGMEENGALGRTGEWMNEAFRSEKVLGNKPCEKEKEDILMKKKNE